MKQKLVVVAAFLLVVLAILAGCGDSTDAPEPDSGVSTHETTEQSETDDASQPFHSVTFNSNGGSEVAAQSVQNGKRVKKPDDPKRTGYSFLGWTYQDEAWSFAGYTVTEDITLDAKWSTISYSITFNLNDGGAYFPSYYTIETNSFSSPDVTRAGYDFIGWTWDGQTEPQKKVTIEKGSFGNKTYTANWELIAYTITCDLAGGTMITNPNPTQYTVESNTITIAGTPERAGYTFAGWSVSSIPHGSTGNKTVTANWNINNYSIAYELNGGSGNNPTQYTVKSNDIALKEPMRAHYIFLGWTWNGQSEPQKSVTIASGSYGNRVYTANWEINGKEIFEVSGNTIMCLTGDGIQMTVIEIPSKIDGVTITGINNGAFQQCTDLTNVTIPNSITNIGSSAFSGLGKLTSVTIPNSVTNLGSYAFYRCGVLKDVTLSNKITSIEERTFGFCERLKSITIPDSVISIGKESFWGCSGMKSVIIGNGVSQIGDSAFLDCSSLESVTIGSSVSQIGDAAFSRCSMLTNITYAGTKAQWNAITKGSGWNYNTGYYTIHCTDGDIAK